MHAEGPAAAAGQMPTQGDWKVGLFGPPEERKSVADGQSVYGVIRCLYLSEKPSSIRTPDV